MKIEDKSLTWPRRGYAGVKRRDMPGSWPQQLFPNLNADSCIEKSQTTRQYNCFAWAVGETHRRWEPDPLGIYFWPPEAPRELTVPAFVRAYESRGFRICIGGILEEGLEKIAIFGVVVNGVTVPTHAAVQL